MRKIIPMVLSLIAGLAVLLATTAAHASPPWTLYQPKAPKSLIKAD